MHDDNVWMRRTSGTIVGMVLHLWQMWRCANATHARVTTKRTTQIVRQIWTVCGCSQFPLIAKGAGAVVPVFCVQTVLWQSVQVVLMMSYIYHIDLSISDDPTCVTLSFVVCDCVDHVHPRRWTNMLICLVAQTESNLSTLSSHANAWSHPKHCVIKLLVCMFKQSLCDDTLITDSTQLSHSNMCVIQRCRHVTMPLVDNIEIDQFSFKFCLCIYVGKSGNIYRSCLILLCLNVPWVEMWRRDWLQFLTDRPTRCTCPPCCVIIACGNWCEDLCGLGSLKSVYARTMLNVAFHCEVIQDQTHNWCNCKVVHRTHVSESVVMNDWLSDCMCCCIIVHSVVFD